MRRHNLKTADEIRNRLANILGYCRKDGELHNPENFEKKMVRSKWKCPGCDTVVGELQYRRAMELQWVLDEGRSDRNEVRDSGGREKEKNEDEAVAE